MFASMLQIIACVIGSRPVRPKSACGLRDVLSNGPCSRNPAGIQPERANDGRFSSLMTVDFKALAEDQQAFQRDVIAARGDTKVPVFDGRVVIGDQALELPGTGAELKAGEEIVLTPMALPAGVDPARSLLITDPRVIEDPTRTFNPSSCRCTSAPSVR